MSEKAILTKKDIESFNKYTLEILEGHNCNLIYKDMIKYSKQIKLCLHKLKIMHILSQEDKFNKPSFSRINIFYLEPQDHRELNESINIDDDLKIFIQILNEYLDEKNDQIL
jgi:hypothetical protein